MADTHDYIAEAITEAFGERCPDFARGCACCEAWQQYDRLREERDEARKDVGLLLQDAANKGEEPDILMTEIVCERKRADRAEEAFAICKLELDKTRKALILTPMAERLAELPDFMVALSEWGCEDPNEQAKAITDFLNSLVGLKQYLDTPEARALYDREGRDG